MNKDFIIKLCFSVYQITELFPKDADLRLDIRNTSNRILTNLILVFEGNPIKSSEQKSALSSQTLAEIKNINKLFTEANAQNWINPLNFLVLEKEYAKIEAHLKESLQPRIEQEKLNNFNISPRQKKILEGLKTQPNSQMRDIHQIFPKMSKRTLQRDVDILLSKNLIKRQGKNKEVSYFLTTT